VGYRFLGAEFRENSGAGSVADGQTPAGLAPAGLKHKGDEAPGPTHILSKRLAQGRDQRLFLDKYSIAIACPPAIKKRQKPGPISKRQAKYRESDETSSTGSTGWVADVPDMGLLRRPFADMNGDIVGEKSSQNRHGGGGKGPSHGVAFYSPERDGQRGTQEVKWGCLQSS
jgi:hypothetical protein